MHVYNRNLSSIHEHYPVTDDSSPYEGNLKSLGDDIFNSRRFLRELTSREKNLVLTSKGTNMATFSVQTKKDSRDVLKLAKTSEITQRVLTSRQKP